MTRFWDFYTWFWDFAFAGSRWQFERCGCKNPTSWGHWQCFYGFEYRASVAFPAFAPIVFFWSLRSTAKVWKIVEFSEKFLHMTMPFDRSRFLRFVCNSEEPFKSAMLKRVLYVWAPDIRWFLFVLLYVSPVFFAAWALMTGVTLMQWSKHRWISHAKPLTCNDPWRCIFIYASWGCRRLQTKRRNVSIRNLWNFSWTRLLGNHAQTANSLYHLLIQICLPKNRIAP